MDYLSIQAELKQLLFASALLGQLVIALLDVFWSFRQSSLAIEFLHHPFTLCLGQPFQIRDLRCDFFFLILSFVIAFSRVREDSVVVIIAVSWLLRLQQKLVCHGVLGWLFVCLGCLSWCRFGILLLIIVHSSTSKVCLQAS